MTTKCTSKINSKNHKGFSVFFTLVAGAFGGYSQYIGIVGNIQTGIQTLAVTTIAFNKITTHTESSVLYKNDLGLSNLGTNLQGEFKLTSVDV